MLVRRLRLVRAAWGGGESALALSDLRALAAGLPGRDIRLDLSGLTVDAMVPAAAARVVLNLLMLAAEALAGQGVVALAGDPSREILLTIEGPRAAWPPGFAAMLVDECTAWAGVGIDRPGGPRTPQTVLTALIAHASGLNLSMLMATQGPPNAPLLLRCVRGD
jgi:histidine phosphotransferase ChpT